jgi:uncharacterized membrane protein
VMPTRISFRLEIAKSYIAEIQSQFFVQQFFLPGGVSFFHFYSHPAFCGTSYLFFKHFYFLILSIFFFISIRFERIVLHTPKSIIMDDSTWRNKEQGINN